MTKNNVPLELVSPFTLKDDEGFFWVKGNLHSHTTNSDGQPSPQERVDGYGEQPQPLHAVGAGSLSCFSP